MNKIKKIKCGVGAATATATAVDVQEPHFPLLGHVLLLPLLVTEYTNGLTHK